MGFIAQIFLSNPVTSWNQTAKSAGHRTTLCSQLLAFGFRIHQSKSQQWLDKAR